MNIQIIGTKSCQDTRKAERYFKERRIPYQFRDLKEKGLSEKELNRIAQKVDPDDLLDREGKQFKKRQMEYMVFDTKEELLEDPLLLKTPIVRNGKYEVAVGHQPDRWQQWIDEADES